jgi:hypothetical protein
MLKALYFPHTEIHNPVIIKNALLLWDQVETIVPHPRWNRPQGRPSSSAPPPSGVRWVDPQRDKWFCEAAAIITEPRVPTDAERRQTHQSLASLAKKGFLLSLVKNSPAAWQNKDYLIYPEKFLDETWRLLESGGLARWVGAQTDYGVPSALGFLMMSILAEVCAGTQIQKITDRSDAYGWLAERRARALGSQYITDLDISQVAPGHDRLVSFSLEALDGRKIPLRKLVQFRQREAKSRGSDYAAMRRRYAKAVQAHIDRLGTEAKTASDVRELDRQFKDELKTDLNDLKAELGIATLKTLFSKEVVASAVIVAGALLAPITGLTTLATQVSGIGVIPLIKAEVEYRALRREILRKHSMSWLFLASQRRLSLR